MCLVTNSIGGIVNEAIQSILGGGRRYNWGNNILILFANPIPTQITSVDREQPFLQERKRLGNGDATA